MHNFNGREDWYKYKNRRVIRELKKVWPDKSGQVIREFLGV